MKVNQLLSYKAAEATGRAIISNLTEKKTYNPNEVMHSWISTGIYNELRNHKEPE
jgi:hypothetical protein